MSIGKLRNEQVQESGGGFIMLYMKPQIWIDEYFEDNKKLGKSKKGLAEALRIDPSRVSNIIKGTRNVSSDEIVPMANYLGLEPVTVLSLLEGDNINLSTVPKKAPLISWVEAGALTEVNDPYQVGDVMEYVNTTALMSSIIALIVSGESMNRVAPPGSTIIVDYSDKDLIDGKFYVVRLNNDNSATFKRYRSNPDRLEPYSTEHFDTIYPQESMSVVGRVVEIIQKV